MKYAFIADIHEDTVSLRLAIRKISKKNCDQIICLGDISGYSIRAHHYLDIRNASACLAMLRDNCSVILAGNHDLFAAQKIPQFNKSVEFPADWHSMDYYEKTSLHQNKVWYYPDELPSLYSKADLEYLRTLPEYYVLNTDSKNVLLTHYIYPNLTGCSRDFYNHPDNFVPHRNFMKQHNCSISFAGHRHYLGLFIVGENKIVKKRLGRKRQIQANDCVLAPPIVREKHGHGFCIFDSKNMTVETQRL